MRTVDVATLILDFGKSNFTKCAVWDSTLT